MSATQKTILMICGDRMEKFEAKVPFQALQAYGFTVDAVFPGKKAGDFVYTSNFQPSAYQTFSETEGHKFILNATFDEVEATKYDGLLIPGGRAPEYIAGIASVVELVQKYAQIGKPIASICHGSLILAAADVVRGQTLTAFPSLKVVLIAAGAHWVPPHSMADYATDGCKVTGAENKRILFLCGDFTEELEIMVPFQSLQAVGCHIDAVCPNNKVGDTCITIIHEFESVAQTYSARPGYSFPLTETFEGLNSSSYDALVVPGGQAPEYLSLNEDILELVKEFTDAGKPVGSMGHGQMILYFTNALKGKKCTAHPSVKLNVVMAGVSWSHSFTHLHLYTIPNPIDLCFTDGNLVSGAAWPGNSQFIYQLMAVLGIQVSF
ncbi:hypothetical protein MKX03_010868 [Papaver bracteatum]|nr:hypothetical protein MKX03_010868 [Papaver bracteatum]